MSTFRFSLLVVVFTLVMSTGCSMFLPIVVPLTEEEMVQVDNLEERDIIRLVPAEFVGTIEPFGSEISAKDAEIVASYANILKSYRKWGGPKSIGEYRNRLKNEVYKLEGNEKWFNHFLRTLATSDLDPEVQEILKEYTIWLRREGNQHYAMTNI